jgi:hypothetical protein
VIALYKILRAKKEDILVVGEKGALEELEH